MEATTKTGGWLLLTASILGWIVAIYDYFFAWGIDHTIGSLIVLASMTVMVAAALVIVLDDPPRWARIFLGIGLVVDFLGTALAAYFLESYLLVALSLLAGIGWLIFISSRRPAREQPA